MSVNFPMCFDNFLMKKIHIKNIVLVKSADEIIRKIMLIYNRSILYLCYIRSSIKKIRVHHPLNINRNSADLNTLNPMPNTNPMARNSMQTVLKLRLSMLVKRR